MDLLQGPFRERRIIKRFLEAVIEENTEVVRDMLKRNSTLIENYVDGIADATDIDADEVMNSEPVENYIDKILGEESVE